MTPVAATERNKRTIDRLFQAFRAGDIFRFNAEGKIIEHWDVLQQVPDTTASGNDMFSQLT